MQFCCVKLFHLVKPKTMKPAKFLFIGIVTIIAFNIQAQVSVNVNLGAPPQWGPVGYSNVDYYYLPDVESYYYIPTSRFIYFDGQSWVHRKYLPARYKGYDLYNGYKVVLKDYRGKTPYIYFKDHKKNYSKGYRGSLQKTIGKKPGKAIYNSTKKKNNISIKTNNKSNSNKSSQGKKGGKGKK